MRKARLCDAAGQDLLQAVTYNLECHISDAMAQIREEQPLLSVMPVRVELANQADKIQARSFAEETG